MDGHDGLSASDEAAIDAECDRFEADLRRGERPDAAGRAASFPPRLRARLLLELAAVGLQWSAGRGETVSVDAVAATLGLDAAELSAASGLPLRRPVAGRFELVETLGAGAFGTTWRARDGVLGRDVALKLAHAPEAGDGRFEREVRAAAKLAHDGIATVHETLRVDGREGLVTELVPGRPLHALIAERGAFPPREAARLVAAMADALQHAHERGVVHRDVKPANVVVRDGDGRPVLVDFGLAHDASAASLTLEGHVLGTPAYMSPEQALGDARSADERTDVHACGAVLYELITGRPPFPPGPGLLERVAHDEPVPPRRLVPAIDRDLETVTLKALSKRPSDRHASAAALADDLRAWLDGRPVSARPPSHAGRAARWARRNPALAASVTVAAGLLLSLALVSILAARNAARQRDAAVELLRRTRAAEAARLEETFEARLAEAESHAWSSRPGGRFAALDAAEEAWRIQAQLPARADRARRARSVVLAALCAGDMRPLPEHLLPPGAVTAALSRDLGRWAVTDALGGVSILDADGNLLTALVGARDPVVRLDFSPDDQRLLGITEGTGPPELLAWNASDGRLVARLSPAPWPAWAHEGHDAFVALPGRGVGRLSLDDGSLQPVPGLAGVPMASGPSGLLLVKDVAGGRDVSVVDLRDGRVVRRFRCDREPWVAALDPSAGRWALTSSGRDVVITPLQGDGAPRVVGRHDAFVVAACASPDGRFAATHGWDGMTRVWDLVLGTRACESDNYIMGAPLLHFADEGRRLAWHSDRTRAGPFEIAVTPPFRTTRLTDALGFAPGIGQSLDGAIVLAWAEPGVRGRPPRAWDSAARRVVPGLEDTRSTTACCVVPGGRTFLTAGADGVREWILRREPGGGARIVAGRRLLDEPTHELAASGDGAVWAAALGESLEVVVGRLADGKATARLLLPSRSFTLALDEHGDLLAAGSWHGRKAAVLRVSDGALLHEPATASSIATWFSPFDGALLTNTGDELRLLDPLTGAVRATLVLGGGSDVPGRMGFLAEPRLLAVVDPRSRRDLRLLDPATLDEVATLGAPALAGESLTWCTSDAAGRWLSAGSVSGTLVQWNLPELRAELAERGLDWAGPASGGR